MLFIMSIFNNNFGNILLYDIILIYWVCMFEYICIFLIFYIIGLEIYFKVVVISDNFEGILFIKVREGFMM